jgi:hypothetical protein
MTKRTTLIILASLAASAVGLATWWRASVGVPGAESVGTLAVPTQWWTNDVGKPSIPVHDVASRLAALPPEYQDLLRRIPDQREREERIHGAYITFRPFRDPQDLEYFLDILEKVEPTVADRDAQTEEGSDATFRAMSCLKIVSYAWHSIGPIVEAQARVDRIIDRLKNHQQSEVRAALLCLLRLVRDKAPPTAPVKPSFLALIERLEKYPGITLWADNERAGLDLGAEESRR